LITPETTKEKEKGWSQSTKKYEIYSNIVRGEYGRKKRTLVDKKEKRSDEIYHRFSSENKSHDT
jgi:hypothetical protein